MSIIVEENGVSIPFLDLACDRCERRLIAEWYKNASPAAREAAWPLTSERGVRADRFHKQVLDRIKEKTGWRYNPQNKTVVCPRCAMIISKKGKTHET